jgi:hypothetical protein
MCSTRHDGKRCEQSYLAEHRVEDAVARYYSTTVRFDAERIAQLEAELAEAFNEVIAYREHRVAEQRKVITRLETERRRLLDAHLAGAVPLELFNEKQRSLAGELGSAHAKVAAAERSNQDALSGLELTCKLLRTAGEAYHEADAIARRAWNQAFSRDSLSNPISMGKSRSFGAELTEPFGRLLSEDLAAAVERLPRSEPTALVAGGSNVDQIVETVGIEPTSAGALGTVSTSVSGALCLASRSPSPAGLREASLLNCPGRYKGCGGSASPLSDAG